MKLYFDELEKVDVKHNKIEITAYPNETQCEHILYELEQGWGEEFILNHIKDWKTPEEWTALLDKVNNPPMSGQ